MNPAVSLVAASRNELAWRDVAAYIAVQFAFGILGAGAAHLIIAPPSRSVPGSDLLRRFG
jgi:glycerol uptake facilitator-like aquaporin